MRVCACVRVRPRARMRAYRESCKNRITRIFTYEILCDLHMILQILFKIKGICEILCNIGKTVAAQDFQKTGKNSKIVPKGIRNRVREILCKLHSV